jgi:uncharacterized Zn finger protein (UPF0148 family)
MLVEKCRKCGSELSFRADGRTRCRPCDNSYQRSNYASNIERSRKRKREHMAKARQDPKKREAMNARRRENPKFRERGREYGKELRTKHFFKWRARNWGFGVTARELAQLWKSQRGRCALSGRKLERDAHLDHILPVSLGGYGKLDNLRWVDPWANGARGNLSDLEFMERCKQVAEWIGRRIMNAEVL